MSAHTTQLPKTEVYELIDKLASATSDLVTIHDVESDRIVYHNNSDIWKGMLNVDVYELRVEELVEAIVHPGYQENVRRFLQGRKELQDSQIAETETRLLNDYWICIRSKVFQRDRQGQVTQIISFISNITHVRKVEQELAGRGVRESRFIREADDGGNPDLDELKQSRALVQDLTARLLAMDKVKVNFLTYAGPQLLDPLTLLMGSLGEIVQDKASGIPTDRLQKLELAYQNVFRLQKRIQKVLAFAKIEAGKLEAVYQPTDFSKVTTDIVVNFRPVVEKAGLRYVVKSEMIATPVYLNNEMWEKVVLNLLTNAFKFTHEGKIEVTIREKKKHVELRVRDTGIGIAAENLDRIFEWFTRVDGTQARAHEGPGIGLALVRELVVVHGGRVRVKSIEGVGSEFTVSIPKGKNHLPALWINEPEDQPLPLMVSNPFIEEAMGWGGNGIPVFQSYDLE